MTGGVGHATVSPEIQNLSDGLTTLHANPDFVLGDGVKRDAEQAHQVLDRIFDESKIQDAQDQAEAMQIFSEEASRVIGDIYEKQANKEAEAEAKAKAARDAYARGLISKARLDAPAQT